MDIDVESSIRGLWITSYKYSYLGWWFPRFHSQSGRLIPLCPGLNVFYGRNGAGKTQLLQAIAHTAQYKMSAFEGFVLWNPRVTSGFLQKQLVICDSSPKTVLARYTSTETEDMALGPIVGFLPEKISKEKQAKVHAIIEEFLAQKHCLLTRAPVEAEPERGDPLKMNDPESIQLVPMLLSGDDAPITRAHAKEIYASYLNMLEANKDFSPDEQDGWNELSYEDARAAELKPLVDWLTNWEWSPLINLRNFGWVGNWNSGRDEYASSLRDCDTSVLFLPAIWSFETKTYYAEFRDTEDNTNFYFSLTQESPMSIDEISSLANVKDADIGYPQRRPTRLSVEEERELRGRLLPDYVTGLRKKLAFLPSLRNISVDVNSMKKPVITSLYLNPDRRVRVSKGSDAERRWVALAKAAQLKSTQWIIIDEPESGLHRTAEADLAEALASPAWNSGSVIVVATHSPEFLDLTSANVLHLDEGEAKELTSFVREELEWMGLRPGDLLTTIKSFLLVEGEHEKIIFEHLFAREFRKIGCKVIVARGGKNMKDVFESQMIFEFTDAKLISLMDNIDAAAVTELWGKAREMASKGLIDEAGEFLRAGLPRDAKHIENVFLKEFLSLALKKGEYERVEVWGLSKSDIVLYLPSEEFGLRRDWDVLLTEHASSEKNFKDWASGAYGADFSNEAILRATQALDTLPVEFGDLIMKVAELSKAVAMEETIELHLESDDE